MDSKITLSFDSDVISAAKRFAENKGLSLSRLTEILLKKVTTQSYTNIEDFPIADWVHQLSEDEAEYKTRKTSRKAMKSEFFESKK